MNIVVANGFGMEQCSFYSEEYHCCVLHNTRCKCEDYNPRSKKPTTNYDLLISKTPEELAGWLAQQEYRKPRFDGWLPLCNHVMGARTCHKDGCEKCWLDWLKQEARDERL